MPALTSSLSLSGLPPPSLPHVYPKAWPLEAPPRAFLRVMNCSANFAVGYNLMALPGPCLYYFSCVVSPVAFGKVVAENSGEFCRVKAILDSLGVIVTAISAVTRSRAPEFGVYQTRGPPPTTTSCLGGSVLPNKSRVQGGW